MDIISKILKNVKSYEERNPEVREAVKEGYEVAYYLDEFNIIVTKELVNGTLRVKIIEEAHLIPKSNELNQL